MAFAVQLPILRNFTTRTARNLVRRNRRALEETGAVLREALEREAPEDLGVLSTSFQVVAVRGQEQVEVTSTAPYAGFVAQGTRQQGPKGRPGAMPPPERLEGWVERKGIAAAVQQEYGIGSFEQAKKAAAFLVARSIQESGIAPDRFDQRALRRARPRILAAFRRALSRGGFGR